MRQRRLGSSSGSPVLAALSPPTDGRSGSSGWSHSPVSGTPVTASPWSSYARDGRRISPAEPHSPRDLRPSTRPSGWSDSLQAAPSGSRRRGTGTGSTTEPLLDRSKSRSLQSPPEMALDGGGGGGRRGAKLGKLLSTAMVGLIDAIVAVPVMLAFQTIIFRSMHLADPQADAVMQAMLVKLVLISSVVHQCVFSACSSLPFAIGQVQDAGLIFLSLMAKTVMEDTHHMAGATEEERVSTVLVALALSTALLGVALCATGYLRMANLVQYLPLPVVAGYLAYIGLYCFEAGLGLMTGLPITQLLGFDAPAQWRMLLHSEPLIHALPGVGTGVLLFFVTTRLHHKLIMPGMMLAIPAVFFASAAVSGHSAASLRESGWLAQSSPPAAFYDTWDLFGHKIHWAVLPSLLPTWLGMYVVVAFSSCLDVAAVSMDMQRQLSYNHELKTVGLSNICSGLIGGFTGSYIFSMTIFTFRSAGADGYARAAGLTMALIELVLFAVPWSMASELPLMFFGAVLCFIAIDLMVDWLFRSYTKVKPSEYVLIWLSFFAINLFGLEAGMVIGVALTGLHFLLVYGQTSLVHFTSRGSNVMRALSSRRKLEREKRSIVALELRGFVFFGSVARIMEELKRRVMLPPIEEFEEDSLEAAEAAASRGRSAAGGAIEIPGYAHQRGELPGDGAATGGGGGGVEEIRLPREDSPRTWLPDRAAEVPLTRFVLIDFSNTTGIDATAVRSCFCWLQKMLRHYDIKLVLTNMSPDIQRLFEGHEIIGPLTFAQTDEHVAIFASFDEGMEYCEDLMLNKLDAKPWDRESKLTGLAQVLSHFLDVAGEEAERAKQRDLVQQLSQSNFFALKEFGPRQLIFRAGDESLLGANSGLFFVEQGNVELTGATFITRGREEDNVQLGGVTGGFGDFEERHATPQRPERIVSYKPGGAFGQLDFFLSRPRNYTVESTSVCRLYHLTGEEYERMKREAPQLALLLHECLLKATCLDAQAAFSARTN